MREDFGSILYKVHASYHGVGENKFQQFLSMDIQLGSYMLMVRLIKRDLEWE